MEVIVSSLAGVATAACLWKPIFGDWEEFWDCVKFWLTPDLFSLFRGEYWEDWWSEMKLVAWVALSFMAGSGVGMLF